MRHPGIEECLITEERARALLERAGARWGERTGLLSDANGDHAWDVQVVDLVDERGTKVVLERVTAHVPRGHHVAEGVTLPEPAHYLLPLDDHERLSELMYHLSITAPTDRPLPEDGPETAPFRHAAIEASGTIGGSEVEIKNADGTCVRHARVAAGIAGYVVRTRQGRWSGEETPSTRAYLVPDAEACVALLGHIRRAYAAHACWPIPGMPTTPIPADLPWGAPAKPDATAG